MLAAGPRLSAIMAEQQAIIAALRDLLRSGRGGQELFASAEFPELVARLERAQSEQRLLLSPMSGERVGAAEQRLLVQQSRTKLELLAQCTSGPAQAPSGTSDEGPSSSRGRELARPPRAPGAHPPAPPGHPVAFSPPRQPPAAAASAPSPMLIDFS